jgi:hypothetical protein
MWRLLPSAWPTISKTENPLQELPKAAIDREPVAVLEIVESRADLIAAFGSSYRGSVYG